MNSKNAAIMTPKRKSIASPGILIDLVGDKSKRIAGQPRQFKSATEKKKPGVYVCWVRGTKGMAKTISSFVWFYTHKGQT
jgi:hypothetical protein